MAKCTMHEVVETHKRVHDEFGGGDESPSNVVRVLPYRCSRCKGCFCCQHKLEGYQFWICIDGVKQPVRMDPGVQF